MTREEAIDAIGRLLDMNIRYHCDTSWIDALRMAIEALHREEAEEKGYCHRIRPSNVEVVVRCKDCIHGSHKTVIDGDNIKWCEIVEDNVEDKDYCSRGERREPHGFVADEWYRDTFGENNGK